MANNALNRTSVVILTNKSGGDLTKGAVVITGTATAKAFTTTTTSGYKSSNIGVLLENIANNAPGMVALGQWTPKINLASSAALYDFVKAHTVAGQGTPHAAPSQAGDFAIALETGTTPSAFLFGIPYPASFDASALDITGTFALSGDISPSQITSNQNDYNPTGLSGASVLRLNSDASRNITGLAGGADGRIITIYNTGSTDLVLKNNDSGSSAANRFSLQADITLAGKDGCILIYDSTSSLWRCIGKTPGGSGGSAGALVLVEQHTASSSASLDFTTGITATYDDYLLEIIDLIVATDNVTLKMQYSSNAGSSWYTSSDYYSAGQYIQNGAGTGTQGANPGDHFVLGAGVKNTVSRPFNASLHMRQFLSTALSKSLHGTFNYTNQSFVVGGYMQALLVVPATAFNAFKIFASSGNIASGVARLYGVAKS